MTALEAFRKLGAGAYIQSTRDPTCRKVYCMLRVRTCEGTTYVECLTKHGASEMVADNPQLNDFETCSWLNRFNGATQ